MPGLIVTCSHCGTPYEPEPRAIRIGAWRVCPTCSTPPPPEAATVPCEQCGRPMLLRWGKYGKFLGCSGYPECKSIRPLEKPVDLGIKCPDCGEGNVKERKSRWGKVFYGCDRYPECKFASWDKPVVGPCPDCGDPILVEKVTKRAGHTRRCRRPG